MRHDLTDITVVLDRSGSMQQCRQEAENGLAHFVEEQKKAGGAALFTLVQFDTEYEFVHRGVDLNTVGRHRLVPRGMTALLDAVGRAINETGTRLAALPEANRPGLVVFVILTDGLENSSSEFTLEKIKSMIEHQQSVYRWQFTFLGANQDAFAEANKLGIDGSAAGTFQVDQAQHAFAAVSRKVSRMRAQACSFETPNNAFTDEEREELAGSTKSN